MLDAGKILVNRFNRRMRVPPVAALILALALPAAGRKRSTTVVRSPRRSSRGRIEKSERSDPIG